MQITTAALRGLLIVKARTGRWDPRYCTLHGVSPKVNNGCRRFITRGYAALLVPTSTLRTPVGGGSYHQARNEYGEGMAVDLGRPPGVSDDAGRERKRAFQRREYDKFRAGRRRHMVELLGPLNDRCVLRGRPTVLAEGSPLETQHDTHVHGAFQG